MADQIRRAMLTAAHYATGRDDLRELLSALGLHGQPAAPKQANVCGSVTGYNRHRKRHERPCWECREAYNADERTRRRKKAAEEGREIKTPAKVAQCGTPAGLTKHYREHTVPCEACRKAERDKRRAKRGPAKPRTLQPCGTNAAYQRHRKRGEQPCDACLAARAVEKVRWRAAAKKKRAEAKS